MKRILLLLSLLAASLIFTGCSDKIMGYSVVLWNSPEYKIKSGDVVPVYIKSNISHVYVIGVENGEKIELPLWQLTEPVKKSKINAAANKYSANARTYASVKLDGLPCRAEPVNTAKQVYRLRKGEVIKVLYKGKGAAPMAGKTPLEGDWYRILTDNGTQGWCFSYNLNLFETDNLGQQIGVEVVVAEESEDKYINIILNNTWYPEKFRTMISNKNIDISAMHPSYHFAVDQENAKVILNTSEIHESWDFDGYNRSSEKEYQLKNVPITIVYKNAGFIVLKYTDASGKPQDLNFVTISESLSDIVNAEKQRRANIYAAVVAHGPKFSSSSYGTLTLAEDSSFKWTNYKLLVPSVISSSAKGGGTVSIKYTISKSLSESYDGVLSFRFDGMSSDVNFLYKMEEGGIRFEDATSARFSGNTVTARGSSPVIVYFKK